MSTNTGHKFIRHDNNTGTYVVQIFGMNLDITCESLGEALQVRLDCLLNGLSESAQELIRCCQEGNDKGALVHGNDVTLYTQWLYTIQQESRGVKEV